MGNDTNNGELTCAPVEYGLGERSGIGEAVDHDMDHLGDTDPVFKISVGSKRRVYLHPWY